MYGYIFFDLDGTLTNPKLGITRCVQYALEHFGIIEPDLDKLEPFIGPPLTDSFMEFYGLTEEQTVEAIDVYRSRFTDKGIFENEVLEGVPEMLAALKAAGRVLTVSSSKPEPFVERILERFELRKYFDVVVGATMDEKRTAKNEVIEETLRRLKLTDEDKKDVLMVGDRRHDVEGAHQCDIKVLGVKTGFANEGELEKAGADFIADTVEDMKEFLLGQQG